MLVGSAFSKPAESVAIPVADVPRLVRFLKKSTHLDLYLVGMTIEFRGYSLALRRYCEGEGCSFQCF
jgi:hypothetical protein